MAGPMAGSALTNYGGYGINPINQVTPFTYRDNATYLTILNGLCDYLNTLVDQINTIIGDFEDSTNAALAELLDYINSEIARLEEILNSADGDAFIFDPTQGQLKKGSGQVVSRVYDNTRIYAYFANEYDALGLTAKAYDDAQYLARHYDLSITYPDLHAVQGE